VTLVSSLFWLELGLVAGLVGVAGASLTLCSCCRRGGTSLSSLLSVRTCFPAQMHACGQQCRSTVTYSCPCSFSIWGGCASRCNLGLPKVGWVQSVACRGLSGDPESLS